jgi:four helix bundle protein
MNEEAEQLKQRTKDFAIRVVRLFRALPHSDEARIFGRQVLRSATSVGANYRAVCRARSHADFVNKLGVVVEEMDETVFWLEMIRDTKLLPAPKMDGLLDEAGQLLAIFVTSQLTAKRRSHSAGA